MKVYLVENEKSPKWSICFHKPGEIPNFIDLGHKIKLFNTRKNVDANFKAFCLKHGYIQGNRL